MFRHVPASRLQNAYCLNLVFDPHQKMIILFPVIFHPGHSFKRQNALSLTKKLFIKVFMVRCSCVVIFNLKEKSLCFGSRDGTSLARSLLSKAF